MMAGHSEWESYFSFYTRLRVYTFLSICPHHCFNFLKLISKINFSTFFKCL